MEKQRLDFEKRRDQERKRVEKLEKETQEMLFYGLWQSEDQVDAELGLIKGKKEKEEALKVQLRFRKNVFKQKSDSPDVYAFSKVSSGKRVPLSIDELKANVLLLITQSQNIDPSPEGNDMRNLLVGKCIEQKFKNVKEQEGAPDEFTWYKGKVISQVPGFPRWFNLIFEDDEAVYTDTLIDHYRNGDLKIVV